MPMKPSRLAHIKDMNQKSSQAMNDLRLKPETRQAAAELNKSTQACLHAELKQNYFEKFKKNWNNNKKIIWLVLKTLFAICCLYSVSTAWGEKYFIAVFAENFVMYFLWLSVVIGGGFGSLFAGYKVADKAKNGWVGLVAGIFLFWCSLHIINLMHKIPGVSTRLEQMLHNGSPYDD